MLVLNNYNENFWGDKIKVHGVIKNTATVASYKDAIVRITYYSKTKTELGSKEYTIYDIFPAHSEVKFELKIENYKDLNIKRSSITTDLKQIFYNNVWDLKNKCEELKKKNKIEQNDYYNAFLNEIYLLDYKQKPQIMTIKTDDFYNLKYNENVENDRNEANYISHFKT